MKNLLLVVDMQNGFIGDESRHIIPNIIKLVEHFQSTGDLVAFTRFINYKGSPWTKWIKWSRFMEEPEINIISELKSRAKIVIDKYGLYSSFTNELNGLIKENDIHKIIICGIATDGCVLKTAVDSFEKNIEPVVVQDASYSHAGEDMHKAGLLLISRFIGKLQINYTNEIIKNIK